LEIGTYDRTMDEQPKKRIVFGASTFISSKVLGNRMKIFISHGSSEFDIAQFVGMADYFKLNAGRKKSDKALAEWLGVVQK